MPHAFAALALGDLRDRAPAHDRQRLLLENVWIAGATRRRIVRLDQEPLLLLLSGARAHAHEMPFPVQLFALEHESEAALPVVFVRVTLGIPTAAIPDQHGATAVLPLRDGALEAVVLDRMILDVHGQALLARHQAWAARDGPALHHPVELEPEIVVQAARRVLLDHESVAFGAACLPARLRRDVEPSFALIRLQAHCAISWVCNLVGVQSRGQSRPRPVVAHPRL